MSNKIIPSKTYSAKEAFALVTEQHPEIKKESEFRDLLRKDIDGANNFNAKVYTKGSQPRFIIRGADLERGLKLLHN